MTVERVRCVLVPMGVVFFIEIDNEERVEDLKILMQEKKKAYITCHPDLLKLYQAKKTNGEWLTSNDNIVIALKKGEISGEIKGIMTRSQILQPRATIKALNLPTNESVIHVVVQMPPEKNHASFHSMEELVEASLNKVLRERDEKASTYSLSQLTTAKEERILKKMRLTLNYIDYVEPDDTTIAPYQWLQVAEDAPEQRAQYIQYLKNNFKITSNGQELHYLDVARDSSLLTIQDPRLPFRMNGTADVLLVDGRSTTNDEPLAGIRVVIELTKKIERNHRAQVFGQLVSASLKAPLNCTPIGLLTDLNDHWHFSWFSAKTIVTHVKIKHPKNALIFLAAAVADTSSSMPFRVPFIQQELMKFKVDDFLRFPDDGAADMMERYELMADMIEPEFLMARRMEYAQHLVQTMPMYAHMYA